MQNNQCCLSVIVPCYNIEDYLEECLDSLRKQTYEHFQVILVDDGSTDSTGKICDKIAYNDCRFKVVHTKNNGLPAARKEGLKLCDTEYVTFVDGDDFIHPDTYAILMNDILQNKNADIIVYGVADFINGKICHRNNATISAGYEVVEKINAVLRILDDEEWKSYMVNKIYRISLFNGITFPIGRNLDEDTSIMHAIFHHAKTILYNQSEFYYYRHREGSICLSFDLHNMCKKSFDRIAARWERLQFVESHPEYHAALNKQRNMYLAVGLAVMRIVAKYPQNYPAGFFDDNKRNIQSVEHSQIKYMEEYFNRRKQIELFVLCKFPLLFKLIYKILPAW